VWRFETRSLVSSSPAVVDGVVYFGSWDSVMYALDIETGELLWSYKARSAISSGPAVVDGMVYMTSWDASVYAFGIEE
jgi:outer membrane protein assembly factor BamB